MIEMYIVVVGGGIADGRDDGVVVRLSSVGGLSVRGMVG